jgi:competence protein ComGC
MMHRAFRSQTGYRRNGGVSARACLQRGQALVFVTVTVLVMVIAMMLTYNIGQLTNQKIRLQNTADAAAYSAAVAQARDYNFSAYMNRAMIANDVAVAQVVALRSWTENYNETFKSGCGLTDKANPSKGCGQAANSVQAGPMYTMWTIQENVARTAAKAMKSVFENGAKVVVPMLQTMNTGFAATQKIYHYSTALTVAQILGVDDKFNDYMRSAVGFDLGLITNLIKFGNEYNVVKMNDPNAALSLLGFASYAYDTSKWLKFTENRNPVGPWGTDQSDESWSYTREECHGWEVDKPWGKNWCWGDASGSWGDYGGWVDVTYYVSDVRTRNYPDDGTFDGPRKDRYANVVISSLDSFTTDRNGNWYLPILVDPVLLVGPASKPPSWFFKMLFHDATGVELWNDGRSSNALGQANKGYKAPGTWNNRWKANDQTTFLGLATFPVWIPVWGFVNIPGVPYKSGWNFPQTNVNVSTGNASGHPIHISASEIFRTYRDVKDIEQGTDSAHQNWTSPPILVEVERPTGTIRTTQAGGYGGCAFGNRYIKGSEVSAVFAQGNLSLGDGSSANCMRALAKSEAYFSRPTDLWPRSDQKTEYGSLYSPYWQARLIKTTLVDQTLSLITHYCTNQASISSCANQLINDFRVVSGDFVSAIRQALN